MGLNRDLIKNLGIKDVKRVQYWDSRYYKVLYEVPKGDYVNSAGVKLHRAKSQLIEEHMPSVTEILGVLQPSFLAKWRGDVGNERADQIVRDALQLGSFVHFGADVLARGDGIVIFNPLEHPNFTDEEVEKLRKKHKTVVTARFQVEYVQLWRIWQFLMHVRPKKVQTEQTVFSVRHKYAGTLDGFAWIDEGSYNIAGSQSLDLEGGWYVWDYKTGKGISQTNRRQISSYVEAVLEGNPKLADDFRGGLILHTNNEKIEKGIEGFKATLVNMREQHQCFGEFMKIFEVYKIEHPIPDPSVFSMPALLEFSGGRKR